MELHLLSGREKEGYTAFGSYWEKGEIKQAFFTLTNEKGEAVPLQSEAAAWWPDRSIKWCTHTADAVKLGETVRLEPAAEPVWEKQNEKIRISRTEEGYQADTGAVSLFIPHAPSEFLAADVRIGRKKAVHAIYPVFVLERRCEKEEGSIQCREDREYRGRIDSAELEQEGPLQAVFCFRGSYVQNEEVSMPFVIRMYIGAGSRELRFVHTFLYDGNEQRDFLKGMGIRLERCMTGPLYDRHVQVLTDQAPFHEAAVLLESNHPRLRPEILEGQLAGERVFWEEDPDVKLAAEHLPVWNRYVLYQDSAYHYQICKQTVRECCRLVCREGKRAPGVMAAADHETEMLFGIRDFWEKYPSGLEADGLGENLCKCTLWFYSPEAEAFDFRHYSQKSYPETCYEGFAYVAASAYGIGVTSEAFVSFQEKVACAKELERFGRRIRKPPVYVGTPEYYHKKRAFGYWSLPTEDTQTECWLEGQLEQAFSFYKNEIEARNWYGLFDYGDIMHTYDAVRHHWRYDMGGFAWQNTELVPTYWLWIYFLRTGREDVFSMAEAMSRHCSEVDIYHFGKLKGLGSRHNVRHWGCSCKEPRIAMAGHHRFLYYLTGDRRLKDVFCDVKDADFAMARIPHGNDGIVSKRAEVRSGPDWSSFVSSWMTWYEITLDETYRKRIETGIADIAATPYGFASGPDYYYDLDNGHLIYRGEMENTPNQHLQICMGGPQIWLETADMLENETLKELLIRLGVFYFTSREEKIRLTQGRITKRDFSWPMLASGTAAYSAAQRGDRELAKLAWQVLLADMKERIRDAEFTPVPYETGEDGIVRKEIPGITTNFTAQWCLNAMMCLEWIRDALPKTDQERKEYMERGGIRN